MSESVEQIQAELLSLINDSCAQNCDMAKAKVRAGAQAVMDGGSKSEVMFAFVGAVASCRGPKPSEVCGGEELEELGEDRSETDRVKYLCAIPASLVGLTFVESTTD